MPDGKSKGKSIDFNAIEKFLSFSNDFIVGTGIPGDPLVGAKVNVPDFLFEDLIGTERFLFFNLDGDPLTITNGSDVFATAQIAALIYERSRNLFYWDLNDVKLSGADPSSPLFDPTLPDLLSPYLKNLDALLNPFSPSYDKDLRLYFTYTPDADFYALTTGLSTDGHSPGTNGFGISSPIPEPSTITLVGFGFLRLAVWRVKRKSKAENRSY